MGIAIEVAKIEGAKEKIEEYEKKRMADLGLTPTRYTLKELLKNTTSYYSS